MKDLKERFDYCISHLRDEIDKDTRIYVDAYYKIIVKTYSEDYRHYHTLEHIEYMLTNLDKYFTNLLTPLAKLKVEMGIWFHDIIYSVDYDPGVNEMMSSHIFGEFGKAVQLDVDLIEEIKELILITTHTDTPTTIEQKVICDLDLLGLHGLEYFINREKVFNEYTTHFSEDEFLEGRHKFLNWMLNKKTIYHTGLFQKHFEESARYNLILEKRYFYA